MDFLTKAVAAVISVSIKPIWENVTYPFKVTENVKALNDAAMTLVATEADVKNEVENGELHGLRQTNLTRLWFHQVRLVKEEVSDINAKYVEISPCLGRWYLNCWSNYWISKDAAKELKVVQDLCQKGEFKEVVIQLPPRPQEFPISSEVVAKEEGDLGKILGYIDSDDDDDIIGIWGMGGVGKTRLLHLVHNSHARSGAFDVVMFVTASRECSVEKVQAELCEKYGFNGGTGVASRARIIYNYLCERSFLLLLDDLWDQIDLEEIGIPLPQGKVNQLKRKLIISTRLQSVCHLMNVKKELMVACLDFNNALRLFCENMGNKTTNLCPEILSLAENVVQELDGLPLALITIGRAMRAKKYPGEWEYAINLLSNSRLNEIETTRDERKIYYRLKFSYDSLQDERLKDCFLACALWPEDYLIERYKLIEFWMGLGILPEPCYGQNIYNTGDYVIGKLLSACLLEEEGFDRVKMHDVIRDMALWIACDLGQKNWIVRVGLGVDQVLNERECWENAERATLTNPGYTIPGSIPCEAKKLCFLKVHSNRLGAEKIVQNLESFFSLTFLDLSNCSLSIFPQCSNLVNLKYFNLSNNQIRSVPKELGLITKLNHLFLRNNKITSFPSNVISKLCELQTLDLYEISEGSHLTNYVALLMEEFRPSYHQGYIGITLYCVAHFNNLLNLSPHVNIVRALSLHFCEDADVLLISRSFLKNGVLNELSLCKMAPKIVFENDIYDCQLKNLEQLSFHMLVEQISWKGSTRRLFPRLRTLKISVCPKLEDIAWTYYLQSLRQLHLTWCQGITQLVKRETAANVQSSSFVFPSLAHLVLIRLPALNLISTEPIMFPSLEFVYIEECPKLKELPFNSTTIPSKLTTIKGVREWWNQLEWKDNDIRMRLQDLFEEIW